MNGTEVAKRNRSRSVAPVLVTGHGLIDARAYVGTESATDQESTSKGSTMPRALFSIRHKVVVAVAAVYLCMAATIVGSYYLMHLLEGKITFLEDVSKLEESVLELRRFEKNFFLYGDPEFLRTALYHLVRVRSLLEKNMSALEGLYSKQKVQTFQEELNAYDKLMSECADPLAKEKCYTNPESRSDYETSIRRIGTSIADFATTVARRKRESIKQTMAVTVHLQLVGLLVVGVGLVAVGAFLLVKVTKPLKLLEESTSKVAAGRFEPIESLPEEKELRDIFDSFNRMARRLQEREEQLVQSKKLASLGTMLAGVAHEVNNPLSNISSSCEILLEELDDADKEFQRKILTKVLEQVDKARIIVLNLLEFSRHKEFARESLSVKEVIDKTVSLLRPQKPDNVKILTFVDAALRIYADRQRIEQAFMNLISNAFQAIEGDGEVRIRAFTDADGMVSVRIRDTGKGIPQADLPQIFDPFFTTKDVGKGTGLGLFITHDIIVRHQGSIRVESTPGKGTTFCVKIPAEEQEQ
jgi:two-component system, NtrC family, sensor kinase